MTRLTKWMVAPLLATGLMFFAADAPTADAGGFSLNIGNGGFSYGNYGYGGYGGRYGSYRPSYGYGGGYGSNYGHRYRTPVYNHGGHYDYHPTQVVPHGNHYDVYPGHYDYHQGGHHGHH